MTATASGYYEIIRKDEITYVYDRPRKTVYVSGFAFGRFLLLLIALQLITALMFADGVNGFSAGGVYALFHFITVFFVAVRLARLRVYGESWSGRLGLVVFTQLAMSGGLLIMQWLAHGTHDVFLLGFLTQAAFFLAGLVIFGFQLAAAIAPLWDVDQTEIKVLPLIIVPIETLRGRTSRMQSDSGRLRELPIFHMNDPALASAWEKKNTDAIEQLLRAGDELNRNSWLTAIGIFNTAKDDIDLGRGRLRYLVEEADRVLAPYHIDYDALNIDRSGVLHGDMAQASLPPKEFMQKLDYSRGMSMAVTKAATGNVPWQAAAVALVFSGIMMAVNHQKLMRQLKELEGQVNTQAQAVRGDFTLIESELALRLIPQFNGLLDLIARLEAELKSLHDAETSASKTDDEPKARAFQLACSFREAQYLLEMKAGN